MAEPTATPPAVAAICWNIDGCCGAAGMPTALGGAAAGTGGGAARATGAGAGAGALLQDKNKKHIFIYINI